MSPHVTDSSMASWIKIYWFCGDVLGVCGGGEEGGLFTRSQHMVCTLVYTHTHTHTMIASPYA